LQKTLINNLRFRKGTDFDAQKLRSDKTTTLYSENFLKEEYITSLKSRGVALAIFLFYFIENGTLGLIPEKYYFLHRNVRLSDLILYVLVAYSLFCYKEYRELIKSRSFLIAKIFLAYIVFEFIVSFIRYEFNPIEYFFRLKGIWSSFLIFPYMLLIKRNGFPFLIKIIFPVAVVSNFLYLLTALTGIPFLPDVLIVRQPLPGDLEVFRVFGGTFYGELFFLGFVYYWITKRFRMWQMFFVIIFVFPHVLAMGRLAWLGFVFTILVMILLNFLTKKNFRVVFRQAVILIVMAACLVFSFLQFVPESEFYVRALNSRLFQGQDDVKYGEGTYGMKAITQNAALVSLWKKSDLFLGIGMHPMWVVGPDTREESLYYSALSDVSWPAVLAVYGIFGFAISFVLQIYYLRLSFRIIKNSKEPGLYTFLITLMFAKLVFDVVVGFSYIFLSAGLWVFFGILSIYIPVLVHMYEQNAGKIVQKIRLR
jgi:hypothetical protein